MKNTAVAIINFLNTLRGFSELLEKEIWAELEKRFGQAPRVRKNLAVDHAS